MTKVWVLLCVLCVLSTIASAEKTTYTEDLVEEVKLHEVHSQGSEVLKLGTMDKVQDYGQDLLLMKLKASPEDCAIDRLKNFMKESWKNWLFPDYKFRVPVTGFIHIVKENSAETTEDDFVDFSADDFYIDTLG